MIFAGVILFGFISTTFLRQELFPPVVYPQLTVVTHYANAAPEEIENLITKPIEEAVGSTSGLRGVTSVSREGLSLVIAEFGWDQDMDFAALGVREKIDLIKARLPRDAEEPTVVKFNPFELPAMTLSVSSEERNPVQLRHFSRKWIKDEMEKIAGVASATISGGADEEILVEVDQGRLMVSDLGILDISKAIAESNLNYPGGTIKENFYEYLVRTIGEFQKIDEIGKVAVGREEPPKDRRGAEKEEAPTHKIILLKDVAEINRQIKERGSFSRFNGRENLTVSIHKQAQANTIQVVKKIMDRLKELEFQLPEDIQLDVIDDQAEFIKEAITGVRDAAVQGGVLAFLVLLVFLRNLRSSALIIIVIPVTVLATFTLMYFSGISLNVISLGGIALGVGMLIDNAIVVIENVDRHSKMSKNGDIKEIAQRGTEEVIPPLMASTLTTVMVFLPMIFITGIAGQIFKELAWVVVVTQLFSIVVAFTLLPMLIVKTHSRKSATERETAQKESRFWKIIDTVRWPIVALHGLYTKFIPAFLNRKGRYLSVILLVFVLSIFLMSTYEQIVMPRVDQGKFTVKLDMPVGTLVAWTNRTTLSLEKYLQNLPEVRSVSAIVGSDKGATSKDVIQQIGSHQARLIVILKGKRKVSTTELLQQIRSDLEEPAMRKAMGAARVNFIQQESAFKVGGEETAPVVVNIKGNNLKVLEDIALKIEDGMRKVPGIFGISDTVPENAPETRIIVNKDRAAFYRLSVTDLATASHISLKGTIASKFKEGGREIDIRVVLREEDRGSVRTLPFILMHSPLGISVPLNEVVRFDSGVGPSEIKRISQERTVQVFAKIFKRSLNDVTADVQKVIDDLHIPIGYATTIAGESLEVQESFNSMRMALILSLILVYMVMAAQFESYFQPFIIMFTVPVALIGVVIALGITGTAISVVVILGIILMAGIVVNNGILLIDFTNTMIQKGKSVREAVVQAGTVRYRPILMTALTTVLAKT